MPTVFIDDIAVPLPARTKGGDEVSDNDAELLNTILHRRVKAKLRWLLSRREIRPDEVQAKADELCDQPMLAHVTLDDSDEYDPIMAEALVIAKEAYMAKAAAEGVPLPEPKHLDMHLRYLVNNVPVIQEKARIRVEARYKAASKFVNGD
jgi:hypothetical protein